MGVELNRDAKQIVGDGLIGLNAALGVEDAQEISVLTWTIETVSDREPVARRPCGVRPGRSRTAGSEGGW